MGLYDDVYADPESVGFNCSDWPISATVPYGFLALPDALEGFQARGAGSMGEPDAGGDPHRAWSERWWRDWAEMLKLLAAGTLPSYIKTFHRALHRIPSEAWQNGGSGHTTIAGEQRKYPFPNRHWWMAIEVEEKRFHGNVLIRASDLERVITAPLKRPAPANDTGFNPTRRSSKGYNWAGALIEAGIYVHKNGGLPEHKSTLVAHIADWFSNDQRIDPPTESEMRRMVVDVVFRHFGRDDA
jgi:hypothetical protein